MTGFDHNSVIPYPQVISKFKKKAFSNKTIISQIMGRGSAGGGQRRHEHMGREARAVGGEATGNA